MCIRDRAWGSGIPKMLREAKEYGLREPELIDMGSDFRINLYRKDAATDQNGVIDPKERDTNDTNDTKAEPNDTNEEAILRILRTDPKAKQKDVAEILGVSLATVKRLMNSPVSYTHLELLGQLDYADAQLQILTPYLKRKKHRSKQEIIAQMKFKQLEIPVSYTHLDVYKRQHLSCSTGVLLLQ